MITTTEFTDKASIDFDQYEYYEIKQCEVDEAMYTDECTFCKRYGCMQECIYCLKRRGAITDEEYLEAIKNNKSDSSSDSNLNDFYEYFKKHAVEITGRVKYYIEQVCKLQPKFSAILCNCKELIFESVRTLPTIGSKLRDSVGWPLVETLLSTIAYVYQLSCATTTTARLAASYLFIRAMGTDVIQFVDDVVINMTSQYKREVETEAGYFDMTRSFWDTLINSEFIISLREFILMVVSMKWLGKDMSKNIVKFLGKPSGRLPLIDVVTLVLRAISRLFKYGEEIYNGTPVTEVLFSPDPVAAAINATMELLTYKDRTYTGLPVEGMMCRRQFRKEAGELLTAIDGFIHDLSPFDTRGKQLKGLRLELFTLVNDLDSIQRSSTRQPPIAVVWVGPPGIGKSKLLKLAPRILSKVKGREYSDDHIYTRSRTSDYWEGYIPASHPFIHYSEVGNESDRQVDARGSKVMEELNSLIDGVAFNCDMAFDDKGKVYANPEMVIIDTNNASMHIDRLMKTPSAMYRRFVFIDVRVKDQFRVSGSSSLDVEASLEAGGNLMDRYIFSVYTYKALGEKSLKEVLLASGDIFDLSEFLFTHFERSVKRQTKVDDADLYSFLDNVEEKHIVSESMYVDDEMWKSCATFGYMLTKDVLLFSTYAILGGIMLTDNFGLSFGAFLFLLSAFIHMLRYTVINYVCILSLVVLYICRDYVIGYLITYRKEEMQQRIALKKQRAMNRIRYLCGYERLDPYITSKNARIMFSIIAGIIGILSAWKLISVYKNRTYKKGNSESSNFVRPSVIDESLKLKEDLYGCDSTRKRVATSMHPAWNVMYGKVGSGICVGTLKELEALACRNARRSRVKVNNSHSNTVILGVCSTYALMNAHAFQGHDTAEVWISNNGAVDDNDGKHYTKVFVRRSDCIDVATDLVLFDTQKMRFRNIVKHFIDGPPPKQSEARMAGQITKAVRYTSRVKVTDSKVGDIVLPECMIYFVNHHSGMCGMPLIVTLPKGKVAICGIHEAGVPASAESFGIIVERQVIEKGINLLESKSPLLPIFSESELCHNIEEPLRKSPFRHEFFPHLKYYGKECGLVTMNSRSSMVRIGPTGLSKFFKDCFDFERTVVYGKPAMQPFSRDGEYYSLWNNNLRKMNHDSPCGDRFVEEVVINRLVRRILTCLRERGITKLNPIVIEEAVNGSKHDAFLRRINPSTSGGYGYSGSKASFIPLVDEEKREITEELRDVINCIFETYNKEEGYNFTFVACAKDEPRDMVKVLVGATRVFFISPLDMLIVARMFLSPFYTLMVEHSDVFCTAVGWNMHKMSHVLVEDMAAFSENMMEGDYSGYDVANPFFIARCACTVIYRVLEAMGYNQDALRVVQGLMTDNLYPVISMNKDVFVKPGMQPSGKYATAEDNSLRGLIMLMYSWYSNEKLIDKDFFSYVKPLVYGDDMLAAVKPEVSQYFNNLTYQYDCKKLFGMKFTTALKHGEMSTYVNIHTMSFLKRTFVKHKNGRWVGKLSLDSIYKMLEWMIPSKEVTAMEQIYSTYQSACWELFFHCVDEDQYRECTAFLRDAFTARYDVQDNEYLLPTYTGIYNTVFEDIDYVCDTGNFELSGLQAFTEADYIDNIYLQIENLKVEIKEMEEVYERIPYTHNPRMLRSNNEAKRLPGLLEENREAIRMANHIDDLRATLRSYERMVLKNTKIMTESETFDMSEQGQLAETLEVKETLVDVAGTVADKKFAGKSMGPETGQREISSIDKFFERPVEIDNFVLAVGSDLSASYPVWSDYTSYPAIRAKLRNYCYLKCDLRIRITVSGSPFHYGKILVSYQPFPSINENLAQHIANLAVNSATARPLFLNYLSQAPGAVVIDVKANKPVDLHLPFIMNKPMFRLHNSSTTVVSAATPFTDLGGAGTLYVYSINTLRSASATPSDLSIQIYAHAVNVQLGCPTATQIEITTESEYVDEVKEDERERGVVERFATSMGTSMDILSEVPVIAPLAKASGAAFRRGAEVASWFGFSKPPILDKPLFVKNRPFSPSALTICDSTVQRVVIDPKQELPIDPRVCGTVEDDMSIAAICKRRSYLTTFGWTSSDAPMTTMLFSCRVTPEMETYVDQPTTDYFVYQPTALAFAARPFRHWRGSITYRIEVVCSAYHRGKLAIAYEPDLYQYALITADLAMNKNYVKLMDIEQVQTLDVCINWAHEWPWSLIDTPGRAQYNHGSSFSATAAAYTANGFFVVFPFTRLQSPDGSSIEINVYVSSDNMHFQKITHENLPVERVMMTESEYVDEYSTSLSDTTVECIDLNQSSAVDDDISLYNFGEQPVSFRQMLKRFVTTDERAFSVLVLSNSVIYTRPIMLTARPAYAAASAGNVDPTLIEYLPYAYLGVRGGVRKRVRFLSFVGNVFRNGHATISLGGSGTTTTLSSSLQGARLRQIGSAQFVPDTNGGVEAELPFYTRNLFAFSFADDMTDATYTDSYSRQYEFMHDVYLEVSDVFEVMEDTAIGEDFSFMRYMGAPMYSNHY